VGVVSSPETMSETPVTIETLLAEHDWLSALARRLVVDAGTADDLVQETWLTALRSPPRHRRGLRGWLATVLRHRATDARVRDQRERRRAERAPPARPADDPAEVVARAELAQRVARLTLALPEPYRATILMRYHRGRSPKEIAERLGEPAGTVRSRLKRGLDMLRVKLDGDHDGDRRGWMIALMPLVGTVREAGGMTMLTAPVKVAALIVVLAVAGTGTAVLLAEPGANPNAPPQRVSEHPEIASEGGFDSAEDGSASGAEAGEPTGDDDDGSEEKEGAKKPSILDRKMKAKYENLDLLVVLSDIRSSTGLAFDFEPGALEACAGVTVNLNVNGLAVRNLLDMLLSFGSLTWTERSPGNILIRMASARKRPAAAERPWFGSPRGLFTAPPPPPAPRAVPSITLPSADMARPTPAARDLIEILVAPDGSWFVDEKPIADDFSLWSAILERPDAIVLIRADASAPLVSVNRVRRLVPRREMRLAVTGANSLPLPRPPGRLSAPALLMTLVASRLPLDATEVYRALWPVWKANAGRTLRLSGRLPTQATVGDGVVLLNEAERFGIHLTMGMVEGLKPPEPGQPGFGLAAGRGTPRAKDPVPAVQPGEALGRREEFEAGPGNDRFFSGRSVRRNLRAGGGGGTQGAVHSGLQWLASQQKKDGSWAGDVDDTALSLLAFLASGETDRTGRHQEIMASGLEWLAGSDARNERAALALAEAWALTGDVRWKRAAQRAAARGVSRGVGRMLGWCGVGAEILEERGSGDSPLDCFHRIIGGETPLDSESLAAAINAFVGPTRDAPDALLAADDETLHDGTLAAFQAGGMAWFHWNRALKEAVVGSQVLSDAQAGSWNPPEGGSRVRTTALRTACLTVYFRYARIFRTSP
jgi:RNA polymerase sigma factor (sigma-70 family)